MVTCTVYSTHQSLVDEVLSDVDKEQGNHVPQEGLRWTDVYRGFNIVYIHMRGTRCVWGRRGRRWGEKEGQSMGLDSLELGQSGATLVLPPCAITLRERG